MGSLRSLQKREPISYDEIIRSVIPIFNENHVQEFSHEDYKALVKIFDNFQSWRNNSLNRSLLSKYLGPILPNVLDIIAQSYATSIMPSISSIQPIDDINGEIEYWKRTKENNWHRKDKISSIVLPLDGPWDNMPSITKELLVEEVNSEVSYQAIRKIMEVTKTSVSWSCVSPAGTSAREHNYSFIDAIEAASTEIADTAGRGLVNFMLASGSGLIHIATQPGFKKIVTKSIKDPHVYGFLNKWITVIKVPWTYSIFDDKTIYCGYQGLDYCEAPIVYSPSTYLFVSDSLTLRANKTEVFGPITPEKKVMHSAGIKVVNPDYLAKIIITD